MGLPQQSSLSGEIWAVIPAAGTGSRMAASRPKQYLPLNGEPLLMHTLRRLASHPRINNMVVVLSADDDRFTDIDLSGINAMLDAPVISVPGGTTRSESVASGLQAIIRRGTTEDQPWVMVHDAARPCVRHEDIDKLIQQVAADADGEGGLLSAEVTDTLWQQDDQQRCLQTLPRDQLRRALTPQLFPLTRLQAALTQCHAEKFQPTDEAEAMCHAGYRPHLVLGNPDNIKVTRMGDLELATLYLRRQAEQELPTTRQVEVAVANLAVEGAGMSAERTRQP